MDTEQDRDELKIAVAHYRDRQFAEMIALMVGLAAETHPEEIRKALEKAFDLSVVDEMQKRVMLVLAECQATAREVMPLLHSVHREIDAIEKRLDNVIWRLERQEAREANGKVKV